ELKERPRLAKVEFSGVKKSDKEKLQEKINISLGQVVTDPMTKNGIQRINNYYIEKGFLSVKTEITKQNDTTQDNKVKLHVHVNKGPKVKVKQILITGN